MQMSLTTDAIRADVAAVGELGDDTVAEVAERISAVLARSLRGRLLDLLSGVAADVSAELPDGRLEVRVAGDDVELIFVPDEQAGPIEAEGDLSARITLRLAEGLKTRVEDGATRQGLSVNAYIVRALERSTSQRSPANRGGSRIRGYGST
jgi:predicted HicB family RNase H-like nuclease